MSLHLAINVVPHLNRNRYNALHIQGKLSPEEKIHHADLNQQFALGRLRAEDFKIAELYYRQAIALQPDLVQAHNNLGEVLQKQGRFNEAVKSCQEAIKIKPDYPYAYHNLGYFFQEKGIFEEAIEAYKKALNIQPNLTITQCYFSAIKN